jgi:chromosome segregation and condensation protein ScpB
MAKLAKPTENKKVAAVKKASNIQKADTNDTRKKPLQFMVPEEFHKEFKSYAVEQGMKMNELFDAMYQEYRSNH